MMPVQSFYLDLPALYIFMSFGIMHGGPKGRRIFIIFHFDLNSFYSLNDFIFRINDLTQFAIATRYLCFWSH